MTGFLATRPSYKLTCTYSACASTQSDQNLSFTPEETFGRFLSIQHTSKTLIRLHGCSGRFEASTDAYANLHLFLYTGSFNFINIKFAIFND